LVRPSQHDLLPKARSGQRLGHGQVLDHMFFDGLEDRYGSASSGRLMGTFADDCARRFGFSREEQDACALTSTLRAQHAQRDGLFRSETTPVAVPGRNGEKLVDDDAAPAKAQLDKIPTLMPAFGKDGTRHGGQLQLDLQWCSGVGADARVHRTRAWPGTAGCYPWARHAFTGTGLVHYCARGRDPEAARQGGMAGRRCRPMGNQWVLSH
jgi:acetyl-CoA acetyltransferase